MFELVLGSNEGSGKVILLRGEIDIYSAPDFRTIFSGHGGLQEDIVLDCSELLHDMGLELW